MTMKRKFLTNLKKYIQYAYKKGGAPSWCVPFLSLLLTTHVWAIPASFLELSPAERHLLLKGELIIKTKEIKESTWPQVTLYGKINTDPLLALSVYAAYDYQKNYVPAVIKSDPIKHISPTDVHVSYERDLPWPLSSTKYTTGNIVSKQSDDAYSINWYLVNSDSITDTKGMASFNRYQDFTIFKYTTIIVPNTVFAPLLKNNMLTDLSQSMTKIISHIETVAENSPELVTTFKEKIIKALKGIVQVYP